MNRKFMEGVWERVGRLEQAEALLSAAQAGTRRGARLRRPVLAAGVAAAALALMAFSPSLIARYQEWLRGPQSAYVEQDQAAVDQGIEVRALAGFSDASTVELLFTLRDLEQDRLGGEYIRVEHEWEGMAEDDDWGSTTLYGLRYHKYDEQERSWLLGAELETSRTVDFEGLALHVTELRPVREGGSRSFPLDELPLNTWLAAPGEEAPEALGITIYTCGLTEEGLELTTSVPSEECRTELRLTDRDGNEFGRTRHGHTDPQRLTFDEVTAEDLESGLTLTLEYSYVPEVIRGDWRVPIHTKPLDERTVQPEGLTLLGAQVKEAAVSDAMVRIVFERPASEPGGEEWTEFPETERDGLRLYLDDGTEVAASGRAGLSWETGEQTETVLYKWMLDERIDPEKAERIELFGLTIPLR